MRNGVSATNLPRPAVGAFLPRSACLVAIGVFGLLLCAGCAVPQPRGEGRQERIIEPTTKRGYWLYLPKPYLEAEHQARNERRWPLVVTFHGMKPFDNAYPQAREWQSEADRFGFIVIAPELRAPDVLGEFPLRTVHPAFRRDEEATIAILDHVFATTKADPANVLSTSWSSGGYMAHYMMNRHPDRFTCLAVRQSNFSATVLDPDATRRAVYHPILILNTENDFAICKKESREAVQWYTARGYRNLAWIHIKDKGHERTPDLAADFFARVSGVQPLTPTRMLVKRQAIDGNPEGRAFLEGNLSSFKRPGERTRFASTGTAAPARRPVTPPRYLPPSRPTSGSGPEGMLVRTPESVSMTHTDAPTARRAAAVPSQSEPPRRVVGIRVSSAIGIEPLMLGFSAECPADWLGTADFLWTLDGVPIGSGVNGQKTIDVAGEHVLSLLIVTQNGVEHRVQRTIRVLPRLASASSGVGTQ